MVTRWADIKSAEKACADCHQEESEAWYGTKMGRSLTPLPQGGLARHIPFRAKATVTHPLTGLTYLQAGGKFTERAAPSVEIGATAKYIMGSGTHAHSYFWGTEDRLYQLPLTWFTARDAWDLSPGYESMIDHPGFYREVTVGCLNCHTDPLPAKPGTKSRLLALPEGPIGCSRCHGDGRAHAEMRLQAKDSDIVVPDRLPPARAADVCAVCHFGGAVRVLRWGRTFADFLPGDTLSDTVAVFVRQQPGQGFGTVDNFTRLSLSKCAQQTPTMTCTLCHPPHPTHAKQAPDRSSQCRTCHAPGGGAAGHPCKGPVAPDCAACHMDLGPSRNIPHVTAVDHFIRTRPVAAPPKANDSPLVWIAHAEAEPTDPDHQILLGRAYVDAWRSDHQDKDAERAERFLTKGLGALSNRTDGWLELATLRRLRGDVKGEAEAAENALRGSSEDRRVAVSVAAARLASGDPEAALVLLDRAAVLADRAEIETLRARALQMLGRTQDAFDAVRHATELQPSYGEAWLALGLLSRATGKVDEAAAALAKAAAWRPDDLRTWLNLGDLQAKRGRPAEALRAYERAAARAIELKDDKAQGLAVVGAAEAQLQQGQVGAAGAAMEALFQRGVRLPTMPGVMGRIFLAQGNFMEARGALEAAVQIEPGAAPLWEALAVARRETGDAAGAAVASQRAAEAKAHPSAPAAVSAAP